MGCLIPGNLPAARRIWLLLLLLVAVGGYPCHGDGFPGVTVFDQKFPGGVKIMVRNTNMAAIAVRFECTLENLSSNRRFPLEMVAQPGQTVDVATLSVVERGVRWGFKRDHYYSWGDPAARHDPRIIYRLPYETGTSFYVAQGANGRFSHTGENRFAVDWAMPEGTPVLAARGGEVVLIRDGFPSGSADPKLKDRANLVLIRHHDGTLGEYVHLLKGTIAVRMGGRVLAGQRLAASGNSGYSRGPHLHFMVFRGKSGRERASLPVRFVTGDGAAEGTVVGERQRYSAVDYLPVETPESAQKAQRPGSVDGRVPKQE